MVYIYLQEYRFLKILILNRTNVEHVGCRNRTYHDNAYNLQLYAPHGAKPTKKIKLHQQQYKKYRYYRKY